MNPILHHTCRSQIHDLSENDIALLENVFSLSTNDSKYNTLLSIEQIQALNTVPFFRSFYTTLCSILFRFHPLQRLTLAVDGSAPISKLQTQLERRNTNERGDVFKRLLFNSRKLSPGNLFMAFVDKSIVHISQDILLERIRNTKSKPSELEIICDSSTFPGESETKIFRDIIYSFESDQRELSRVVCSSDSDCVLSCITQVIPGSFAVDPFLPPSFPLSFFSADRFMQYLMNLDQDNYDRLRIDLVFLCLLQGNDYFPSFSNIDLQHVWREYLRYRREKLDSTQWLIDISKRSIHLPTLIGFIQNYTGTFTSGKSLTRPLHQHLYMMLWSLHSHLTGSVADIAALPFPQYSPSLLEIASLSLNDNDTVSIESFNNTLQPILPLVSSLLLLDNQAEHIRLLPNPVLPLLREIHSSTLDDHIQPEAFQRLSQIVNDIPKNQFSPLELNYSFPSHVRTRMAIGSNNEIVFQEKGMHDMNHVFDRILYPDLVYPTNNDISWDSCRGRHYQPPIDSRKIDQIFRLNG